MTLSEKLRDALAQLDASSAAAESPRHVVVEHAGREFRCELSTLDRVGCAVEGIRVTSPTLSSAPLERLHTIGESLAARLTYLLESIAVIEVDSAGQTVQMRSQPPLREERESSYYELLAGGGRLELRRYKKSPGSPRQSIPAHLTREVVVRLGEDFIAAAG